ncbi:hypothetical protein RGQ15_19735 [Paracoccus sp. MBLB3053]|uniref:Uncharacterized protein n=1 Tax=Paracoccus aurantius TaxID=3073814 RepID=A0ABU2HYY4_9RHOB|nr:hypothetical protein [Paracoccus sp. MBLB3053]MDS9469794.1 hypothetical protein [Paracoccus sp. MBLB3053]
MTPQSTFLIFAPIAKGRVEELRALLATMTLRPGLADPQNALVPFGRFDRLHVARLLVVEVDTWRDIQTAYGTPAEQFPAHLAFLGDIDGDRESFLAQLVELAGEGLRRIFSLCEGFRAEDDLLGWMRSKNVEEAANYVNTRGRTVLQVHEEDRLRRALAAELPAIVARIGEADGPRLHRELVAFVADEQRSGRLALTPEAPTPLGRRISGAADLIGVPLVLLMLSPVTVLAFPFLLLRLRQLERSDPEVLPRPDDTRLAWIAEFEDHDVTNPFSAAGDLKPGLFRRSATAFFLFLLGWSARHVFGRGYLTRVQSIHFARWVFFDKRRRVLFFSNYDGSLESYMDDFINKVAWGLNLVFSNGVGYPSTRFLLKGGAEQEAKFKRYLRNRHQATDVWYKAYPGLAAFDLAENTRVRRGLEKRPVGARALRHWLAGIRR